MGGDRSPKWGDKGQMGEGVPPIPPHLVTLVLVGVDRD